MESSTKPERVLFLLPGPYIYEDRCQTYIRSGSFFAYREPIEECYSAACLEEIGIQCRIIHASPENKSDSAIINDISGFSPDVVVISTSYPSHVADLRFASRVKEISKEISVIARGGQMPFVDREDVLGSVPGVIRVLKPGAFCNRQDVPLHAGKVAENLDKDLNELRHFVTDTFTGSSEAVMQQQIANSKALQYEGYKGRR